MAMTMGGRKRGRRGGGGGGGGVGLLKRKNNLKKKVQELTTLCGVEGFIICCGPNGEITDTWPDDPRELRRAVDRYMGIERSEREKRVVMMGAAGDEAANCVEAGEDFCFKELLMGSIENESTAKKKDDEMSSDMGAEITTEIPNHIFDGPQFFDAEITTEMASMFDDHQLPVLEETPPMHPLEYNTQTAYNSDEFFVNSINSGYQAQPIQAIMPPLPPTTHHDYSFQSFDTDPCWSWL
ncbi:hypothetical protein Scep_013975 [Stephania cephalantha]|uniref:MADS-box domain-containing protein n=1 Tax=Stephania cephalantha TaxID=152367 RepID=A0AAP0J0F3_9MAGN